MFDCRGMDGKIRARCFSRRFFHMQGTIREWTEEKLEGGSSQILETSDLRAVRGVFEPRLLGQHCPNESCVPMIFLSPM